MKPRYELQFYKARITIFAGLVGVRAHPIAKPFATGEKAIQFISRFEYAHSTDGRS